MSGIIRQYRGDSVAVAKVVNITPVSVSAGQVFTVWCNGKPATYKAVAGDTPTQVAAGLAAAIATAAATIPEFAEMLATAASGVLTLTAATAGVPFDVTVTSSGNVTVVETTAGQGPTNEVHEIQLLGNYSGGTFTVTYNFGSGNVTTANIAYNATAAAVQAALVALAGVGAGQVIVTGGPGPNTPWFAAWTGTLAGTAVAVGTINGSGLTGNGSVTVTETQHGNGLSNTIQYVNAEGLGSGTYKLTLAGQTTAAIAYNASPATVQTAIQNLSNVGSGNVSVYGIGGGSGAQQEKDYYFVVFNGTLAGTNVAQMTTNSGSVFVLTLQTGGQTTANDFQLVDLGGATGGTYTVTFQGVTSAPISVGSGAGTGGVALRNAIQSDAGWTVTGNTVTVTPFTDFDTGLLTNMLVAFTNGEGNLQFPLLSIDGTNLTGGSGVTVTRIAYGHANVNEIQTVAVAAAGGTFTLTLGAQTTNNIAYNASSGTIQTRIQTDLSATVTACTVTGSGTLASPWVITFTNPANTAIALMTSNAGGLTGGGSITETVHGTSGINEVQTVTLAAGTSGGTFTLSFEGPTTLPIAYNASSATVQAALRALSTINTVTVSGSAGGPYTVTWSGSEASAQQPLLFADGSLLTGATTTLISLATATWSSGPSHFDDPNNWTPAGVPNSNDLIYFSQGSIDCLYGLSQITTFTASSSTNLCTWTKADFQNGQVVYCTTTNTLPGGLAANTAYYIVNMNRDAGTFQLSTTLGGAPVTITNSGTGTHTIGARLNYLEFDSAWSGNLGLPFENAAAYVEYRQRYLHIGLQTTGNSGTQSITIGAGGAGSGSGKIQLDTDIDQVALKQILSGGSSDTGIPATIWKGANTSNTVNIISGDFGAAVFPGEVATLAAITQRRGTIELGGGVTLIGPIDKTGGQLVSNGATINGVVTSQ